MIRISVAPSPRSSLTRYVLLSPESNWVISRLDTRVTCVSTRTRSFHDPFLSHFSNYRFIEERDRSTLELLFFSFFFSFSFFFRFAEEEISSKLYSRIVETGQLNLKDSLNIFTKIHKKWHRRRIVTPPLPSLPHYLRLCRNCRIRGEHTIPAVTLFQRFHGD